jgi:hypothetical protein
MNMPMAPHLHTKSLAMRHSYKRLHTRRQLTTGNTIRSKVPLIVDVWHIIKKRRDKSIVQHRWIFADWRASLQSADVELKIPSAEAGSLLPVT